MQMTKTSDDTPLNRVRRGIINLERSDPFFSSIILNMRLVAADVGTMCTDGIELKYDVNFVNQCSQPMLDVVLAHEALHVAMGHPLLLLKLPDQHIAREAAELAVNSLIYKRKGFPPDAVLPGAGDYVRMPIGKNIEWYYDALKKEQQNSGQPDPRGNSPGVSDDSDTESGGGESDQPAKPDKPEKGETNEPDMERKDDSAPQAGSGDGANADGQGAGDSGQLGPGEGGSGDEASGEDPAGMAGKASLLNQLGSVAAANLDNESIADAERRWEQIVSEAANTAAQAGKLPGAFEELVNSLIGTTGLPWPILLRTYLTRTVQHGRSYRRPNRRTLWRKDIQPSRISKGLGKVIFGVDTSGSMDQVQMNKALEACIDIGKVYPDFELGIVQFDTHISNVDWFTRFNVNKEYFKTWSWKGRGGTSYVAFFDSIAQYRANVVVLVTDGYPNDGWPDMRKVTVPVIWLITEEASIPENVSKHSRVIMLNKR